VPSAAAVVVGGAPGVADAAGITVGNGPPVRGVPFAAAVFVTVVVGVPAGLLAVEAAGVAVVDAAAPSAGSPSWFAAKPAHPAAKPATATTVTPAFSRACRSFANPRPLPAIAPRFPSSLSGNTGSRQPTAGSRRPTVPHPRMFA